MRLSDALDELMRQRGPRAAWQVFDRCLARLHESDHASFRREFNRIARERSWPGRTRERGKRRDTRPEAWRNDTPSQANAEQFDAWKRAKRIEHLDGQISSLRTQLQRRADGWEWL